MSDEQKAIDVNVKVSQHEIILDFLQKSMEQHSKASSDGLQKVSEKLDAMDSKWDARFISYEIAHKEELSALKDSQLKDVEELQALKNRGVGVLGALGVVFTATATVFADFFSAIKHAIFG